MQQLNESLDKPDAVKALSQTSLLSQLQSKSSNGVFEWSFVFEVGVMQINRWAFFVYELKYRHTDGLFQRFLE